MDVQTIKERVAEIEVKRESLVRLLDRSDLGALRIDVSQAIEEIDDLLEEFKRTFDSFGIIIFPVQCERPRSRIDRERGRSHCGIMRTIAI
ncbi:MAG: hypothetical protein JGK30_11765 [Microcoleus sp. PH2017_40_RAT_O_B]|uniref:hypothetical protein n=2 Tax=Microcoleus TaxID=44471 RepID=UPI001D74BAB7|nr:hypothetical protein [Microcoleus sp. PH2017_40_RAT_O_B]MCC3610153.1 hypothetical protein [Microcoleus sp. PH2017_40_RAT_O_B]